MLRYRQRSDGNASGTEGTNGCQKGKGQGNRGIEILEGASCDAGMPAGHAGQLYPGPPGAPWAAIAAVNIAIREGSWIHTQSVPADFLSGVVYIVWADEKLPVLCAPWELAQEHLPALLSDQFDTLLVSETMERIIWFSGDGEKKLYSIA